MDCPSQVALVLLSVVSFISVGGITVIISQGSLEGVELNTKTGTKYFAFKGIPYVKPPTRFQNPKPAGKWVGVRNATEFGDQCIATSFYNLLNRTIVKGSEDCLYINVYTRNISGIPQPVMVFIHGGGWQIGTGSVYAPDFLIEKGIVLVTFNYRLGVFGFLSTEDDILPGNLGMKDQVAALRWVQENIGEFGGDPRSVTLFGQSSGAASVHYHMISPASQGLFHRAISQSGVALCLWCYIVPGAAKMRAEKIATALNCSKEPPALKKCLMEKRAEEIVLSALTFIDYDFFLPIPFGVVKEREDSEGAFLTTDPWNAPRRNISWMVGMNSGEGAYKVEPLLFNASAGITTMREQFTHLLPKWLMFEDKISNPEIISEAVKTYYFGNKELSDTTIGLLVNVYTDGGFLLGIEEAIQRHIGLVFMYYFDYRGNHSTLDRSKLSVDLGVSHSDEMQYLFPSKSYDLEANKDKMVSRQMVDYWTNFVIHGNPSPNPDENTVGWTPRTASKDYLHITSHGNIMEKELRSNYTQFWKKQFPHYENNSSLPSS